MHLTIHDQFKGQTCKYLVLLIVFLFSLIPAAKPALAENLQMVVQDKNNNIGCPPTSPDSLGPFYKARAPLRQSVGKGYKLSGRVVSTKNCSPIPQARIELWMAGPDGDYKDDFRATVISNDAGEYSFESHIPPAYMNRPPHIHIRVTAEGFKDLITQHYPEMNTKKAVFDLILIPD